MLRRLFCCFLFVADCYLLFLCHVFNLSLSTLSVADGRYDNA
jgi:hypothetical protein